MKKYSPVILCLLMALLLAACGKSGDSKPDQQPTQTAYLAQATQAVSSLTSSEETTDVVPSANGASASIGTTVFLGRYEQDGNTDNGPEPIEWYVTSVENGKAVLVSRNILDSRSYSDNGSSIWQSSSLRQWLNGDFMYNAFNTMEMQRIANTDIDLICTEPSYSESGYSDRISIPTARILSALSYDALKGDEPVSYWLAGSSGSAYRANLVSVSASEYGYEINVSGTDAVFNVNGVRPCITVHWQ